MAPNATMSLGVDRIENQENEENTLMLRGGLTW